MNPFRRFLDFISYPSHSRTIGFLAFLVVLLAVPLTVNIAQKQQELRQHAAGNCTTVQGADKNGNPGTWTTCPDTGTVTFAPAGQSSTPTNPASGTTTCKTDAASAVGCAVGCATVNGRNMKCHLQNKDASGQCSASCTAGGPWNCVEDASCPNTTPTCDASKGFISSCQGTAVGTTQNNAACTRSDGTKGITVKECQSNNCWYDSYFDTTPTKIQQGKDLGHQWCYGGSPVGIQLACTNPTCSNGTNPIKVQSSGNWYCPNPADPSKDGGVAPTCGTGTQITFLIGLDGIGGAGDQKNPNPNPAPGCNPAAGTSSCGSNQSPKHPNRKFFYQIFTPDKKTVIEQGQTTITYDNGRFRGNVTLKTSLADGVYPIKVRAEAYLARLSNISIANNVGVVSPNPLVTGSSTDTNTISVLDYNNLLGCLLHAQRPYPLDTICQLMDLNDDGVVDQLDYNLFVREFSVVQQGD
ncbi:MAG TPA: hypothetical protein VFA93_01325 [Patescibacteria group bacterium]|nr:hypothetical protein [Patescibacteria group bacterium]